MSKIKKISIIMLALVFAIAGVLGGLLGAFVYNPTSQAIKNENINAFNRIGNGDDLFLSTTAVDGKVYSDLVERMGGPLGSVSGVIQNKGLILTINGLDWQVVYRSGDYVTLWLADSYQATKGTMYTTQWKSSTPYADYAAISSSTTIRSSLINTVYPGLFGSYKTLADQIIATPNDLYKAGYRWQSDQGRGGNDYSNEIAWINSNKTTYHTTYSGLGGNETAGTAAYDKLWLPSGPELFSGNSGSGGSAATYPGIWGLNQTELMFSTGDYCWLRSG